MTTYRKSWVAFLKPSLGILGSILGAAFSIVFWINRSRWLASTNIDGLDPATLQELSTLWLFVPLLSLLFGLIFSIAVIIELKLFRLDVDEQAVRVQYGILPWDRTDLSWAKQHIYSCVFHQNGFFGWAFGYGDVEIVGREGMTKHFRYNSIHRGKAAAVAIHDLASR
jgi:uncharacterized membrane protein YdbT with pleckstrin-like domain